MGLIGSLSKRLTRVLQMIPPKEIYSFIIFATLAAILNALWVAYRAGYTDGQGVCGYPCIAEHRDYTLLHREFRIAVALAIIALGLLFRRGIGFLFSIAASAYIFLEYFWWYFDSLRWLKEVGITDFSQLPAPQEIPHAFNLYGANYWNIIVLIIVIGFFVWEIKIIARLTKSYGSHINQ